MAPTEKVSTAALTGSLLWPTTNDLKYATGGKIDVQSTEASSLRVELEGLITAYELLPSDLYITHYMDNTQAIAIHDRLLNDGLPPPHALQAINSLLWARMQQRGTFLSITHVHSHLEKNTPKDHPLYLPRWQLAAADAVADEYHYQDYQTIPDTGIERFPIYHKEHYVENRPGSTLRMSILSRHESNLRTLPHEGAIQRAYPMAHEHGAKLNSSSSSATKCGSNAYLPGPCATDEMITNTGPPSAPSAPPVPQMV